MNLRRPLTGFVAAAGVVGWCDVAAASISYRPAEAPLDGPLLLGIGTTFVLLSAFLERPFYSRAGVEEHPLAYSLLANLPSAFVIAFLGGVLRIATVFADVYLRYGFDEVWLLFVPLAIIIAAGIEYLIAASLSGRQIDFFPLVYGNLCSYTVLVGIWIAAVSPLGGKVRMCFYRREDDLAYGCFGVSVLMSLGIFIALLISLRRAASRSVTSPPSGGLVDDSVDSGTA